MPELPEVETIRRQLEPLVVGRPIAEVWAFESPKFTPAVHAVGTAIEEVGRRGKYLLLALDDGHELVIHLGMTGQLRVRAGDDTGDAFVRAWWRFADGEVLEYRDVRRFGRLAVVPAGDHASIATLRRSGPEPLGDDFDALRFWQDLRRSRSRIKTQLLSQRPVAGIGNIYADEALWLAGVHPGRRTITKAKAAALRDAIREVIAAGVANGGTTLRDYRDAAGAAGRNQHHLQCYGLAGEPCDRCGTVLRRLVLDARGTTYCPTCQR
jgi:formamidopyrimidine-DNA glycosylase